MPLDNQDQYAVPSEGDMEQQPQEQGQDAQSVIMDSLQKLQVLAMSMRDKGNPAPAEHLAKFMQSLQGGSQAAPEQAAPVEAPVSQPPQQMAERGMNNVRGAVPV